MAQLKQIIPLGERQRRLCPQRPGLSRDRRVTIAPRPGMRSLGTFTPRLPRG